MSLNAADLMIETLSEWGVEVIFGLPGDGINEHETEPATNKSREAG